MAHRACGAAQCGKPSAATTGGLTSPVAAAAATAAGGSSSGSAPGPRSRDTPCTRAGQGTRGFQEFSDYASKIPPLGNAPAEDCADYCLMLFSDFTRYVTMHNLYHDGGFSTMGMNPAVIGL